MPIPKPGETEDNFVTRCVPILLGTGTALSRFDATNVCRSLYKDPANQLPEPPKGAKMSSNSRAAFAAKYEALSGDAFDANDELDPRALHASIHAGIKATMAATGKSYRESSKLFFATNEDLNRAWLAIEPPRSHRARAQGGE